MFLEAWLLLGIFVGAIAGLMLWSRHLKKRRAKTGYQWQPDQDYEVVQRGESSMTPPFPHMIKRDGKATGKEGNEALNTKKPVNRE